MFAEMKVDEMCALNSTDTISDNRFRRQESKDKRRAPVLFTNAASSERSCPKSNPKDVRV